jgi:hypothetical protein
MMDIDDIRRETRKLLEPIEKSISANTEDIANLRQTVVDTPGAYAEIVNLIDNSLPEWSLDAYTNLGVGSADAGDDNLECYGFYRQLASDTIIDQVSINALKAAKTSEPSDHSLWAANEGADADIPRWDKVNGYIEMGGLSELWDLLIPIPGDYIFPGQRFYVQLEAMLRTGLELPDIQVFAGLYDSTTGQEKFIEGGSFTITDDEGNDPGVTYGIPGATSVDYKVIAYTDSGEQAESNVLNFPNAPAVFDGNNHPRIKYSGVPGFIRFEIYRKIGTTYVRQFTVGNSIDGVYYDVGNAPEAVVSAFPTVTQDAPRAYAVTSSFTPGSPTGLGYVRHTLTIVVPTTYNKSLTDAGQQYLRIGFTGLCDEARQVIVRKLGLSMGNGKWARSVNDTRSGAHSSSSASATSSGGGGDGGGGIEPPPSGGGGGPDCVLSDSMIDLPDGQIAAQKLQKPMLVDNGGPVCSMVKRVRHVYAGRIMRVLTMSGLRLGCTPEHPLITSVLDHRGTTVQELKRRLDLDQTVTVLTRYDRSLPPAEDTVVSITEECGDFWVTMPQLLGSPVFIANGFLSHNRKQAPGENPSF